MERRESELNIYQKVAVVPGLPCKHLHYVLIEKSGKAWVQM